METVRKLSGTDAPVLILGETGTGKELGRQRDPGQIAARGQALHQGQLRGHP